jgi:hypothetical protein
MTFDNVLTALMVFFVFVVGPLAGVTMLVALILWVNHYIKNGEWRSASRPPVIEDQPGDDYEAWASRRNDR